MDEERRAQAKAVIETLEKEDIKYTEDALKEAYKGEIDRKDKILSSMSVVSAPITILFAGVAFLTNSLFEIIQKTIFSDLDILVIVFYIIMAMLSYLIIVIIYNFHNLLGGENYYYLPNADDLLDDIVKNKEYCDENNTSIDGEVSRYSKANTIMQLSESSTKNAAANDIRLKYRQQIFRSTMLAIICAALGFFVVAIHREQPNVWSLSYLWKKIDGISSQTTNQSATSAGSAPSSGPAQTTPSHQQPNATSPTASPTPGHK